MKFYIASGFQNKDVVKEITYEIQEKLDWELTYDWTQNERAVTKEDLCTIGVKEYEAVLESDVVIVILPGGKGCHTEMGIALGNMKQVILYDPNGMLNNLIEATTFYFLPQINHWNGDIEKLQRLCSSSDAYCASL